MTDLDKIRALLASVEGFTPGPWTAYRWSLDSAEHVASEIAQAARNSGGSDLHAAIKQIGDAEWIYPAFTGNGPTSGPNAALVSAAPTLHAHLTAAIDEIERLRAHNARMAAQINALADACDAAHKADYEGEDAAEPLFEAMVGPNGGDWPEIQAALRALAAGEVGDG